MKSEIGRQAPVTKVGGVSLSTASHWEKAAYLPTCSWETALKMLCLFWRREEGDEWAEDRACCSQGTCCHAQDNWRNIKYRRLNKLIVYFQRTHKSSMNCAMYEIKKNRLHVVSRCFTLANQRKSWVMEVEQHWISTRGIWSSAVTRMFSLW